MANTELLLLEELARAADSHDIRDQLSVSFQREVIEDSKKMQDYYMLLSDLRDTVSMRDEYINELHMINSSNEVGESIEVMRRMQLDDMETASCLMLMAREMQTKVHEKNNFIVRLSLH
ncbi:hypothetical protein Tco_0545221 [Tanacetum coccineum]